MEIYGTEISEKEQRVLEYLVETLSGHFVTVVRKGEGRLAGFSVRSGKTFAIKDLIDVVEGN